MKDSEAASNTEPITQMDLEAFATTLEQWGSSLPYKDQALLHILLSEARQMRMEEVEGFIQQYVQNQANAFNRKSTVGALTPYIQSGLRASATNRLAGAAAWLEAPSSRRLT